VEQDRAGAASGGRVYVPVQVFAQAVLAYWHRANDGTEVILTEDDQPLGVLVPARRRGS
jgi:hypothetical protein